MYYEKNQQRTNKLIRFRISALLILLLGFLLLPNSIMAQGNSGQITAKGKVVDEKNEPIIGASILVEGTKNGTVSDVMGNFR
jgi:hypothetical protein